MLAHYPNRSQAGKRLGRVFTIHRSPSHVGSGSTKELALDLRGTLLHASNPLSSEVEPSISFPLCMIEPSPYGQSPFNASFGFYGPACLASYWVRVRKAVGKGRELFYREIWAAISSLHPVYSISPSLITCTVERGTRTSLCRFPPRCRSSWKWEHCYDDIDNSLFFLLLSEPWCKCNCYWCFPSHLCFRVFLWVNNWNRAKDACNRKLSQRASIQTNS